MRRDRVFGMLAALVAGVAATFAFAAPAHADNHTVAIQSRASLLCLQPVGGSLEAGAAIVQTWCDHSDAQTWFFKDLGNHVFRPANVASGLCLDAFGGASNGTPVVQWPCSSISNQRWQASRDLPDVVTLRSRVAGTSSHCLDVPGAESRVGLPVQIYACNGTAAQDWGVGVTTVIQS